MARELQALQADLFRSGDLVECHVLLASTLLAEKAEKKWLPGEIVGTKESAWNIGRVQYEVLLDIDDVATNGGVRRTVDAEDVRCAFKNGYKWCAAAEHLVLHEPNVGDCVLARYRFEQGNVSGVVWEAGEIKQVHDKRPLSATAHTRYRYTIQYHDGCMDSEVRRQNIMGLESKDGQDYMKSKALRMKLESFRARRSADAALSSQASPVRQASPSSAACGATAAGAGFNDAAHAILATQVTGPHESGFTLPTKRKHILLDDMEPGLRANKIVKGDAWLGGTSLAEASRQWLQIVDASRWIGRGAGSPSAGAKEVDGAKTAQASQAGAECDRGDAQEPCSPASVQLCVGESLLGGSRNGEAMEPEIDNHKARTDGAAERERSWCPLSGVGSDEVLGHPAAESAGASWHGNLNESGDDDKEENGLGELESGMVKDEWEDRRGKEADDGSDREIEVDRKKSGSVTNDEEEGVEAVAAEEEGDTMMDADHRKSDLIVRGAGGCQQTPVCPHCGRDFSSMHPNARAGCMAVHVKACAAKVSFRAACWECREKHYSRKQCREVYRHKGPDWIHDDRNMEEGEAVEADGNNDDCELCGMGDDDAEKGELICCDFCECVYHSSCLDKRVEDLPEEYRCPKCCGTLAEVQADYARRQQKRESMATGVIPGDPVKGKPARPSTETTSLGVSDDDFQIGDKKEVLGSVAEYYDDGESINTVYGPRNGEQQDQRDGINFQSLCWECRFGEYARFKPTFERCRLPFWNVVCESSKTVTKKYGLGHTDCDYFEDERFSGDRHTEKDRVLDFSFSGNELAVADTLHSLVLNAPDGQMATSKLCQVLYTLCADAKSVVKGHGGLKSFTETKLLEHVVEFVPDKGGGKVVTRKAGCRAGAGAAEPAARLDLSPDPLQSPSQKEREQSKHAGFDADSQRKGLEECLGKSLPRKSDELVMNSTDRNMVIDCDKKGNTEAGAMQVDEGTVDTTWEALRRRKEREHERDEGREFVGVVQTCKWSRTSSGISGFFFVYGSGLPSCGIWCGANGYAYWIIRLISGKSSAEISSLPMKDVRSILDGVLIQSEVRGNVDKLEPVQGKSPAARRFRMTGLLAMLTTEQRHRLELLQNEADFPVGLRCEDARDREKNEKFRRVESKYVLATFSPEVAPLLARCELAVDDFWGASGSGRREEADSYFDEEIMVAVKSLPACDAVTVECITRGQIPSGKTEYDVHANKDFVQVVRDSLKDFLKKDMSLVRDARRFFESIMRRKLTECAGKKNVMLHQGRGREGVAESGGEFSVEDKEKGADTACAGWLLVENEFICRMQAHPICDFPDEMRMRGCSLYAQDPAIRDAGRLETLVTVGEWEVRLEGALAKNEENVVLSLIDSLRAKRFVPLTVRGHSFLSLC